MFAHDKYGRCFLGVPPQGYADYAFFQHILASLDDINGRCAILFPHGILNRIVETDIRKELLSIDVLDAIISVGKNLFYNSPMEACVVVCSKNKPDNKKGKVLFLNARDQLSQDGKDTFLSKEHIRKISMWYNEYKDIPGRSRIVENEEILQNKECSLSVSLYAPLNKGYNSYGNSDELLKEWDGCSMTIHENINTLISLIS